MPVSLMEERKEIHLSNKQRASDVLGREATEESPHGELRTDQGAVVKMKGCQTWKIQK